MRVITLVGVTLFFNRSSKHKLSVRTYLTGFFINNFLGKTNTPSRKNINWSF